MLVLGRVDGSLKGFFTAGFFFSSFLFSLQNRSWGSISRQQMVKKLTPPEQLPRMSEPVYSHHAERKRAARSERECRGKSRAKAALQDKTVQPTRVPSIRQEKAKIQFTCWLRDAGDLVQKSMASRWRPQDDEGDGWTRRDINTYLSTCPSGQRLRGIWLKGCLIHSFSPIDLFM